MGRCLRTRQGTVPRETKRQRVTGWDYDGKPVGAVELLLLAWLLGCVQTAFGEHFLDRRCRAPQPPPFPCYYAGFVMRYLQKAAKHTRCCCSICARRVMCP